MSRTVSPPSARRALSICFGVALLFVSLVIAFILVIGRWLVVEDPLEKAQTIVVLSGRMPLRALFAAKLYHDGWAPQVWLTQSAEPGQSLASLNIPFEGEDFYNTRVLLQEGVPPQAIQVLPNPIVNTADELTEVAVALPADNSGVIILVTTKAHTRRVRALWHRLGRGRAIVRAAESDPFDPPHWWRNSGDALDVVRECLGLLNAWAGRPLPGS
jgi:uncharacterized SAM-binding protein YcdF (DUF218 family)